MLEKGLISPEEFKKGFEEYCKSKDSAREGESGKSDFAHPFPQTIEEFQRFTFSDLVSKLGNVKKEEAEPVFPDISNVTVPPGQNPYTFEGFDEPQMEPLRVEAIYHIMSDANVEDSVREHEKKVASVGKKLIRSDKNFPEFVQATKSALLCLELIVLGVIDVVTYVPGRSPALANALSDLRSDAEPYVLDVKNVEIAIFDMLDRMILSFDRKDASKSRINLNKVYRLVEERLIPDAVVDVFERIFGCDDQDLAEELRAWVRLWMKGKSFKETQREAQSIAFLKAESGLNIDFSTIERALEGRDAFAVPMFNQRGSTEQGIAEVSGHVLRHRMDFSEFFYGLTPGSEEVNLEPVAVRKTVHIRSFLKGAVSDVAKDKAALPEKKDVTTNIERPSLSPSLKRNEKKCIKEFLKDNLDSFLEDHGISLEELDDILGNEEEEANWLGGLDKLFLDVTEKVNEKVHNNTEPLRSVEIVKPYVRRYLKRNQKKRLRLEKLGKLKKLLIKVTR